MKGTNVRRRIDAVATCHETGSGSCGTGSDMLRASYSMRKGNIKRSFIAVRGNGRYEIHAYDPSFCNSGGEFRLGPHDGKVG
jgi:hypothetical protein